MKKLFVLLLTVAVAITFAACGGKENISDGQGESSAENVVTDTFVLGDINGLVYENKFIGIGCELDSQWTFYTDEQINELNNMAADSMGEEAQDIMENATVIYDMYAERYNGIDNINVNLEKADPVQIEALDIKQNYINIAPMVVTSFENMGFTNITYEVGSRNIDGQEFACLNFVSESNGIKMYQSMISIKCDGYLANITFTTNGSDYIDELVGMFYLIK